MVNNDTIQLLQECDSGTKMAVSSISEALDKVQDSNLKQLLSESRQRHEILGNELHTLLLEYQSEEKDPSPIAKGMSWLKTNVKLNMEGGDCAIADLITDGCNMGIKTLYQFLNQYSAANEISRDVCKRIIATEETLRKDLQPCL